jgi:hypothetical protein
MFEESFQRRIESPDVNSTSETRAVQVVPRPFGLSQKGSHERNEILRTNLPSSREDVISRETELYESAKE